MQQPIITTEYLKSLATPRGGYTQATLAKLGIPWPPLRGWLRRLKREARLNDDADAEFQQWFHEVGTIGMVLGFTKAQVVEFDQPHWRTFFDDDFSPGEAWLEQENRMPPDCSTE